jgi:hypothetical protein
MERQATIKDLEYFSYFHKLNIPLEEASKQLPLLDYEESDLSDQLSGDWTAIRNRQTNQRLGYWPGY